MPHPDRAQVPMVLCNASYYGTVAAIRSLGRAGIPVVAVDTELLSTGRHSRYVKSYRRSPRFDSANWSDWLLELGRDGVHRAIYATSDAVSFAIADRREELSSAFDLYQPSLQTMMCILDKGLLHGHSRAVGIETPETWFPQSAGEAERIVRDVGGKIVAKPRSQLCASSGAKGMMIDLAVTNRGNVYDRLFKYFGLNNGFTQRFPEMAMPMLQRYYPEATERIYSLSGFRDKSGSHIVMRAAVKILQQPRQLGIGLCFEEADVIPEVAQQTIRLCERIGYYGAFELEFIVAQGRMLLIDFNGRFYNQLAFDIARGMDLPGMVYAGATGATQDLERLVSQVPMRDKEQHLVFCNGFSLSLSVATQQIFKKMSKEEAAHWLEWRKTNKGRVVDAIHDSDDPLPAVFDIASRVGQYIRYPQKFLKDMAFQQTYVLTAALAGCGVL
jgi:predicted ATP-grasp superfamily ATP-dependent carboligase